MRLRRLSTWLAIGVVLAACGCIDYSEQYTIEEQGSGTLKIRATIYKPEQFAASASLFGRVFPVDESVARKFFKHPGVQYIPDSFKSVLRGKQQVIMADYKFDQVEHLNQGGRRVWSFRKNEKGDNEVGLTVKFFSGLDSEVADLRAQTKLLPGLVGGQEFTMRVNFTKPILSCSGARQAGNTIIWKNPLLVILRADSPEFGFRATIRGTPTSSGKAFKIIYAAIVIAMIVGGYSLKLYGSALNFFMLLIVCTVTLNFFEPIAELTQEHISFAEEYHHAVVFVVMYIGLTFLGQEFLIGRGREWLDMNRLADTAGSIVFGLFSGFLVAGVIVIFYFLLPFNEDGIQGRLDPARPPVILRIYRVLANKTPGTNEFDPVGEFPVSIKSRR